MMKKIEGWEGYYMTEEGRVFSTYKGVLKERVLYTAKTGYVYITLYNHPRQKTYKLSRLLAKGFLKTYQETLVVNHLDGRLITSKTWGFI